MRCSVIGLDYDILTFNQAVEAVLSLSDKPGGHIVITAGTEHIMMARKNTSLRAVFNEADIKVADGIGVIKASRIIKKPLPERVGGTDLTQALLPRWAKAGLSVYLLGGKPEVARKAAEFLVSKYPGLAIAGFHDGYFQDDSGILADINAAKPSILLVCLGVPKQEKWMLDNRNNVGDCVMLGLGGSLDVWSGTVKRAPGIFIKLNCEWLWRLIRQPSRIKRIIKLPGIFWAAMCERRGSMNVL